MRGGRGRVFVVYQTLKRASSMMLFIRWRRWLSQHLGVLLRHFKVPTPSLSTRPPQPRPMFLPTSCCTYLVPQTPVGYYKHVDRCWGHKGLMVSRKCCVCICLCAHAFVCVCVSLSLPAAETITEPSSGTSICFGVLNSAGCLPCLCVSTRDDTWPAALWTKWRSRGRRGSSTPLRDCYAIDI